MAVKNSQTHTAGPSQAMSNLPPLENCDRLTRKEFERRYQATTTIKKAELIEGVVYVASPLRFEPHAEDGALVVTWLGVYRTSTIGVRLGDNATVRLDMDNEPQPDALLRFDETLGRHLRKTISGKIYKLPANQALVMNSQSEEVKVLCRGGFHNYRDLSHNRCN